MGFLLVLQQLVQIKKNELGRAFIMYGGEERCIQGFVGET